MSVSSNDTGHLWRQNCSKSTAAVLKASRNENLVDTLGQKQPFSVAGYEIRGNDVITSSCSYVLCHSQTE